MKKNLEIEYENICYVLPIVEEYHKITEERHDLVWYPETNLSLLQQVDFIPFIKSVVTENPWIISCYSRENVRIWDVKRGWIEPNQQTFGCSINSIMHMILGISQTIPSLPLYGFESILNKSKNMQTNELRKELNKSYKKTQ